MGERVQYQKAALVQEQRLKMSPQLLQSIKLLAMPIAELKTRIDEELERNPALELIDEGRGEGLEGLKADSSADSDEYSALGSDAPYQRSDSDEDPKRMFLEGSISRAESLSEHLLWQLRLQPIDEADRRMGELLIDSLDQHGFLGPDGIALLEGPDGRRAERMAEMIQSFEPVGCCTRNHVEALVVQIRLDPEAHPQAERAVTELLEAIEKGRHAEASRKLKLDEASYEELLEYLRRLDPMPGRQYSVPDTRWVVPDISIKRKEGDFVIVLNDEEIPVLGINPFFMELNSGNGDKAARDFAKERVKEARWFIQSINQRNHSLLKVARALVENQTPFFLPGPKHLTPLTLKDIAKEFGVHETTVSLIANGKYVQTEWGIFELKFFFTNSISGSGSTGSSFSKVGVKEVIKELIGTAKKKMSDQEIADSLEARGIKIARRTVAKYRSEIEAGR